MCYYNTYDIKCGPHTEAEQRASAFVRLSPAGDQRLSGFSVAFFVSFYFFGLSVSERHLAAGMWVAGENSYPVPGLVLLILPE